MLLQEGEATAAEELLKEGGTVAGESTSSRGVQLNCKKNELLHEVGAGGGILLQKRS